MTARPDVEWVEGSPALEVDGRPLACAGGWAGDDGKPAWLAYVPLENGLSLAVCKWVPPDPADWSDVSAHLVWRRPPPEMDWPADIDGGRATVRPRPSGRAEVLEWVLDGGWFCFVESGGELRGYARRWGSLPVAFPSLRGSR